MTTVFDNVTDWRHERLAQARSGITLGFVPTMGALHDGHLSLVRHSHTENDRTLVSIFVNPTQFDDPNDFSRYPRTLADDLDILRREGVEFVLVPSEQQLYPDGFRYRVCETRLSTVMEGAHRPGHFTGVLTVVLKLLQIARADRAYFGDKDWQQLVLVRGLAEAFFLPTEIMACPTVRDADGLALSSRNRRLSAADRAQASRFYRALVMSATPDAAASALRDAGFEVQYVEERDGRRLGAVRIGGVRLIDNVPLNERR